MALQGFATNLDYSVPVPNLWHTLKASTLQVCDLPGAATPLFLLYVPKFLHVMDHQGKAEIGTWTLKLESALRSISLKVKTPSPTLSAGSFGNCSCTRVTINAHERLFKHHSCNLQHRLRILFPGDK